jgi:hypothetical protein
MQVSDHGSAGRAGGTKDYDERSWLIHDLLQYCTPSAEWMMMMPLADGPMIGIHAQKSPRRKGYSLDGQTSRRRAKGSPRLYAALREG